MVLNECSGSTTNDSSKNKKKKKLIILLNTLKEKFILDLGKNAFKSLKETERKENTIISDSIDSHTQRKVDIMNENKRERLTKKNRN